MGRFVDLFVLYSNHTLFLEIIMPLVIHLFTIESFICVTFKGNAVLK
jgi:hypothetical protein